MQADNIRVSYDARLGATGWSGDETWAPTGRLPDDVADAVMHLLAAAEHPEPRRDPAVPTQEVGRSRATMSVFNKHRDTLERHVTMMGTARGRLAVAMDLLTDSLALVGQHGIYCRSDRFPGKPKMDIALVLEQLDDAKQLVQSAMEALKKV